MDFNLVFCLDLFQKMFYYLFCSTRGQTQEFARQAGMSYVIPPQFSQNAYKPSELHTEQTMALAY